jgi:hypothetical protein
MDSPGETAPGGPLPPAGPTDAPPGSPAKVAVMAERARLELDLFHPHDAVAPAPRACRAARRATIRQLLADPASRRLLEESLREGIPLRRLLPALGAGEATAAAARRRLAAGRPELVGERARRNLRRGRPTDLLGRPGSRRSLEAALRDGTPAERLADLLECGVTTVRAALRRLRYGQAPPLSDTGPGELGACAG